MPSKITHLTDEQKARFPEWVKRWTDIGLTTGKADRELFERSARACLRLAGENDKVPIIWVSSPIVGAFASSLSALVLEKLRREKVIPREGKAVLSAVGLAVRSAVYSAVDSAVRSAVRSAVLSSVDSAVLSSVRSAVHSAVGLAVLSSVHSSVGSAVRSAVLSAVGSVVGSSVNSAVLSAVLSSVDSAVHSSVDSAVYSAVYSAVDSAVGLAVLSSVHSSVGSAVDSAVKSAKGLFWHYWMGGQLWSGWTAFVSYLVQVANWTPCKDILDRIDAYEGTVRSACYWWPNKDFIMVCERPVEIHRDNRGRLHCDNRKSIVWPDGWGLYSWHGVTVPEKVIIHPEQITKDDIANESNSEVSRAMAERLGWDEYMRRVEVKMIHKWFDPSKILHYELWDFKKRFDRTPRLLKMESPELNDGRKPYYIEPVHPGLNTCQAARRWQLPERENKNNQKVMFDGKWMTDDESVVYCNEHPELKFEIEA